MPTLSRRRALQRQLLDGTPEDRHNTRRTGAAERERERWRI
jgi:hypothetical protein